MSELALYGLILVFGALIALFVAIGASKVKTNRRMTALVIAIVALIVGAVLLYFGYAEPP